MYYSLQYSDGSYLHTGRNSTSKEECINDGIDFLYDESQVDEKEDSIYAKQASIETKENILMIAGYTVELHEELIED